MEVDLTCHGHRRLTWVGRMPCLIPVLCVPDPMTPAIVTSDTAPRLGSAGGARETESSQTSQGNGSPRCIHALGPKTLFLPENPPFPFDGLACDQPISSDLGSLTSMASRRAGWGMGRFAGRPSSLAFEVSAA